jgi:hypothetical protein
MINVKLVRRVHFSQDAAQYAAKLAKIAELIEDVEDVERAVWGAPLDDGPQEGPNVRRYSGEIHLRKELQPSCDFLPFRVSVWHFAYRFQLRNAKTPAFFSTL